jgi:hypothetical protein
MAALAFASRAAPEPASPPAAGSGSSDAAASRVGAILLATIVVLGLVLRLWYASWDPTPRRFWDERYSFDNVRSILLGKTLRPARGYYPSPVVNLPPAALLGVTMSLERLAEKPTSDILERGSFGRRGHLLARGLQAVYGSASLLLLFVVGRRVFSPEVGLLAAAALAFMPWHIHVSGYFKPDALLVLTLVCALYSALRALEEPTIARHLLAGIAIALAMSAKLTGGTIAIPFALAALALGRRAPRRWALLALAGATSAATFVALNPYWARYAHFLSGLRRDYAMRAGWAGTTRTEMPERILELLLGPNGHGAFYGAAALAGLVWLGFQATRRTLAPETRAIRFVLVAFPLLYILLYSTQTAYFKGNNFLPILPFTALAGAALLVTSWRLLAARFTRRRPALTLLSTIALALVLAPPGVLYVYRSLTPTTSALALRFVDRALWPGHGRIAYSERVENARPQWEGSRWVRRNAAGIRFVDSLSAMTLESLNLTDAVVFHASRLDRGDAAPLRTFVERAGPDRVRSFRPALFDARGPGLIVVARPWRRAGEVELALSACADDEPTCFTAELPHAAESGAYLSIVLWAPSNMLAKEGVSARLGERHLDLLSSETRRRANILVSERFRVAQGASQLRLDFARAPAEDRMPAAELLRWEPAPR